MKQSAPWGWGLGIALWGITALAATEPEAALLDRLYTKFATAFVGKQSLAPGSEVFLLSNPGLPITPELIKNKYATATILDQIPLATRLYAPSGSRFSTTYETLLRFAQPSGFQNMADRFAALKAKRTLFDRLKPGKPTPMYAGYLKQRWQYLTAMDARAIAATEFQTTGKPIAPGLDQAVAVALEALKTKGAMAEVEAALAIMNKFYNDNTKVWFETLSEELLLAPIRDEHPEPWYPVLTDPPQEDWLDSEGWSSFTFAQSEKPLPSLPAPQGREGKPGLAAANLTPAFLGTLSLAVETKRVKVTRTWLSPAIFKNRNWRLAPGSGFKTLATGHLEDKDAGLMPLLVTGVLLGRKLVLRGAWKEGADPSSAGKLSALGPFSLATPAAAPAISHMGGELTITASSPQIIGYFCEILPKSPDPDLTVFR